MLEPESRLEKEKRQLRADITNGQNRSGEDAEKEGETSETNSVDKTDPQLYSISALEMEIYKTMQDSEDRKRPSFLYMEDVQRDINSGMRAILIDWLVELTEDYRLEPETLHLAFNYMDQYLSGNSINRKQLQLLGFACMMIAANLDACSGRFLLYDRKHLFQEEFLQMERSVLTHLKFDMAAPTANFFPRNLFPLLIMLSWLVIHTAKETVKASSVEFECLASYITELSLVEYSMLHFAPSMIAASATFLAKFMLLPAEKPWNSTLTQLAIYQPPDLCNCVKALLHRLCLSSWSYLPAVTRKYSGRKYKFVAKTYSAITIPPEYFED